MMKLFSPDSPLMIWLRKITDYMILSFFWLVESLPVITFGASTTAMLVTGEKVIRKEEGKLFPVFWTCFRREFRQATLLWLLQIPILGMILVDMAIVMEPEQHTALRILLAAAALFVSCWIQLWFGYLGKFRDSIGTLLRNTLKMTVADFGKTFFAGGAGGGCVGWHIRPHFTDAAPAAPAVGLLSDPCREAAERHFPKIHPGRNSRQRTGF